MNHLSFVCVGPPVQLLLPSLLRLYPPILPWSGKGHLQQLILCINFVV